MTKVRALMAVALGCVASGGAARAETLADAIALAYQSNPQLQAERASLRAADESYVQARSFYGPTAQLGVSADYSKIQQLSFTGRRLDTRSNSASPTLSANQLLYNGGRTAASVGAAEAQMLAERERLREVEASILLQVVQAYASVLRDDDLVGVRTRALANFDRAYTEAKARLAAGDATQTDVGQTYSQFASARADLSASKGQLQASRASYRAVVGQEAGTLQPPDTLPGLPPTIDEAFDITERDNPELNRTILADRALLERVREAKAERMPTVTARASYGYTGPADDFYMPQYNRTIAGSLTLTQPLFTSGQLASQVRQAVANEENGRLQIEYARRTAVQSVSQYWNQAAATEEELGAAEEAVKGAAISSEGARKEYQAGLRSTLEVLIEQERLRDAQVVVAEVRYSRYVAQASLLNAMGRMEAAQLSDAVPLYDPVRHFNRVRHSGALPWEGLVAALDKGLGAQEGKPSPIPAPRAERPPTRLSTAMQAPPAGGDYQAGGPTTPLPGVMARNTPARIDSAPDPVPPADGSAIPTARP